MTLLVWLVLSFLLVAVSLTAVLVAMIPAIRELCRAARSLERLCNTLDRELPPTLESIRLTSLEITGLTDDVNEGVQSASRVVKQVDQHMTDARRQATQMHVGTRSFVAGLQAAWTAFNRPAKSRSTSTSASHRAAPPPRSPSPVRPRPQSPRLAPEDASGMPSGQPASAPDEAATRDRARLPQDAAQPSPTPDSRVPAPQTDPAKSGDF